VVLRVAFLCLSYRTCDIVNIISIVCLHRLGFREEYSPNLFTALVTFEQYFPIFLAVTAILSLFP
jgi:hypothetical protein